VILNGLFDSLGFDADVTLRGGGRAVLQKPLNQSNVITVVFINLRGIPLAEAVSAYAIET